MDTATKLRKQGKVIETYCQALKTAGMSNEGVMVNATHMTLAVVLENAGMEPIMVPVVAAAIEGMTKATIAYQKKMEPLLDVSAVERAAKAANRALDEVYGN